MALQVRVGTTFWSRYQGSPGQWRYTERYVEALQRQLEALGHDLTVLSDCGLGRPLLEPDKFCGWWSKVEWFRPENRDLRPCLVIDLDTFILGDIQEILDLPGDELWLIKTFFGRQDQSESGLFIAPDSDLADKIWKAAQRTEMFSRGDGQFLRQFPHRRITDEVDRILSYKADNLYDGPRNARIVCFHGQPKPSECKGWAREFFDGCERT